MHTDRDGLRLRVSPFPAQRASASSGRGDLGRSPAKELDADLHSRPLCAVLRSFRTAGSIRRRVNRTVASREAAGPPHGLGSREAAPAPAHRADPYSSCRQREHAPRTYISRCVREAFSPPAAGKLTCHAARPFDRTQTSTARTTTASCSRAWRTSAQVRLLSIGPTK